MNTFVLALTGPTGAGKSSVGERVAKSFERCVNIDADHIKHMIVSGFYKDEAMPGGGGFTEWTLVGDSIGLLATNFRSQGYSIVINGYIDGAGWQAIEKHVRITYKILLLPTLETVISRDAKRSSDIAMGEASVKQHHEFFSANSLYANFKKLDTSQQSVDETVNTIVEMVR